MVEIVHKEIHSLSWVINLYASAVILRWFPENKARYLGYCSRLFRPRFDRSGYSLRVGLAVFPYVSAKAGRTRDFSRYKFFPFPQPIKNFICSDYRKRRNLPEVGNRMTENWGLLWQILFEHIWFWWSEFYRIIQRENERWCLGVDVNISVSLGERW